MTDFATGAVEVKTVTLNLLDVKIDDIDVTTDEDSAVVIDPFAAQLQQFANLDGNAAIIQLQRYGHSVAIDGDLAVVGSDETGGLTYALIYKVNSGTGE